MAQGLISDILKSPEQARLDDLQRLRDMGTISAQNLLTQSRPQYSPVAGSINALAANALQTMPENMNQAVRRGLMGIGSAVGMASPEAGKQIQQMGRSPNERKAQMLQQLIKKGGTDPAGLRSTARQLINMGMSAEAGKVLQLAKQMELKDASAGNAEKNITFFAEKVLKCDPTDKECMNKAMQMAIDYKRSDTAANQMTVQNYKKLNEEYKQAETSRENVLVANKSLQLLEEGKVNIGSFAKTRQGAMKLYSDLLKAADIPVKDERETLARTEELMANTKRLAGQLLASGMFGSGTGISEKDLETAMQMAGASENLTPEGMKRILELNAKMERAKLMQYNKKLDRYSTAFWTRSPEGSKEAFMVGVPDIYQMKAMQGKPIINVPKGATLGRDNRNGQQVYIYQGKAYTLDGKPYEYKENK
jgi:hypothetical protein